MGVIRELGRASRLHGEKQPEMKGDRHNQHPGMGGAATPVHELNPARVGKDTKKQAPTQGIGREPKANRPRRTKAVVAERSTADRETDRIAGEPRPKGPSESMREGEAGHDLWARERPE
jgi:hypothetical protein